MADRARSRDEHGTTLVEMLVAVTVIGTAVVALLGSMGTAIVISDRHRQQATAETVLRNAAETLSDVSTPYAACGSPAYTLPAAADPAFTVEVVSVRYWNSSGSAASFTDSCTTDPGVQLIRLRATSTRGDESESLDVVKRRP